MRLVASLLVVVLIPAVLWIPNQEARNIGADVNLRPHSLLSTVNYLWKVETHGSRALEGDVISDPVCCPAGLYLMYCFVRSADGHLYYKGVGRLTTWTSMGKRIIGIPACVAHGNTVTVIVNEAFDESSPQLISTSIVNGNLGGWISTGLHDVREIPGCVAAGAEVHCAARSAINGTYLFGLIDGRWRKTFSNSSEMHSPIAVWYATKHDRLTYFAAGLDGQMNVLGRSATWQGMGHRIVTAGRPTAVSSRDDAVDVFATGPRGELIWFRYDIMSGECRASNVVRKGIANPPCCVACFGSINCYAVNGKHRMVRVEYFGGKWRQRVVGYGYVGTPSCHIVDQYGVYYIDLYVRTRKGTIDVHHFRI